MAGERQARVHSLVITRNTDPASTGLQEPHVYLALAAARKWSLTMTLQIL